MESDGNLSSLRINTSDSKEWTKQFQHLRFLIKGPTDHGSALSSSGNTLATDLPFKINFNKQ